MNSTQTLNNLIEICKDGQEGFRDAAEHASNPTLKSLLSKYSLQRSTFAGELQEFVIDQGEEPEKNSSVAGLISNRPSLMAAITRSLRSVNAGKITRWKLMKTPWRKKFPSTFAKSSPLKAPQCSKLTTTYATAAI